MTTLLVYLDKENTRDRFFVVFLLRAWWKVLQGEPSYSCKVCSNVIIFIYGNFLWFSILSIASIFALTWVHNVLQEYRTQRRSQICCRNRWAFSSHQGYYCYGLKQLESLYSGNHPNSFNQIIFYLIKLFYWCP